MEKEAVSNFIFLTLIPRGKAIELIFKPVYRYLSPICSEGLYKSRYFP